MVKRLNETDPARALGPIKSKTTWSLAASVVEAGVNLLKALPDQYRHTASRFSMYGPVIRSLFSLRSAVAKAGPSNNMYRRDCVATHVSRDPLRRVGPVSTQTALTNAALFQLPLPPDIDKRLSLLRSTSEHADLEAVTRLDQMRRSVTSVCFIITVERAHPEALTRSVQSVLRQTDPSWEIILCGGLGVQACIAEWLDIDWRIRRLLPVGHDDEVQNLLQASSVSTCPFLCPLTQGDLVDDDLVKRVGQCVGVDPGVELVCTEEAAFTGNGAVRSPLLKSDGVLERERAVHGTGQLLAIRKTLLLNLHIPRTHSRQADKCALERAVTLAAQRIVHIPEVPHLHSL